MLTKLWNQHTLHYFLLLAILAKSTYCFGDINSELDKLNSEFKQLNSVLAAITAINEKVTNDLEKIEESFYVHGNNFTPIVTNPYYQQSREFVFNSHAKYIAIKSESKKTETNYTLTVIDKTTSIKDQEKPLVTNITDDIKSIREYLQNHFKSDQAEKVLNIFIKAVDEKHHSDLISVNSSINNGIRTYKCAIQSDLIKALEQELKENDDSTTKDETL